MTIDINYIPMHLTNNVEMECIEERDGKEYIRLHFNCNHRGITFDKESGLLECPNPDCELGEVDPDEYHELYEDYFDVGDETEIFDHER